MTTTIGSIARIGYRMLTGRIRFSPSQHEPDFLRPMRMCLNQLKKSLAKDDFESFTKELRPAVHVLADLLFDEVARVSPRQKTVDKLRELEMPLRVGVEAAAMVLTGHHDRGRMLPDLWEARTGFANLCAFSISDLENEAVREGFDEILHNILDKLLDKELSATK